MSTLAIRTPHATKLSPPLRVFANLASVVLTVLDVFAEAQRMACDAKRRYPFSDL